MRTVPLALASASPRTVPSFDTRPVPSPPPPEPPSHTRGAFLWKNPGESRRYRRARRLVVERRDAESCRFARALRPGPTGGTRASRSREPTSSTTTRRARRRYPSLPLLERFRAFPSLRFTPARRSPPLAPARVDDSSVAPWSDSRPSRRRLPSPSLARSPPFAPRAARAVDPRARRVRVVRARAPSAPSRARATEAGRFRRRFRLREASSA